jgi:hypothetical protein
MRTHHAGRALALTVAVVGVALACEPIVGTPSPTAPINACPEHACDAYKQTGPAPTCNAGVCTVASTTTNLLLVIGLATDSYLSPGRTYLMTLMSASPAPATCAPPTCCELSDCSPPLCRLPKWQQENPNSYFVVQSAVDEAHWYLGPSVETALPVQATFRRRFGPQATSSLDAFDLGLPVEPVQAVNSTPTGGNGIPGPNGSPPVQFRTYLQPGCYERTLQPFAPFSRAYPPEITMWPPDDTMGTVQFDKTKVTNQGTVPPKFDIARPEGLEGWTAYLRNAQTKRVFSNVVPLAGSLAQGVVLLTNHTPGNKGEALTGLEVVLQPPPGQPLPTEFFAPTGAPGAQELSPSLAYTSLPTPVTVSGRIRTPAGAPVRATVYFTATDILDRSGQKFRSNFEFSTHVDTTLNPHSGESGYSALVPQGDYQIVVRPRDGNSAVKAASRFVGGQGNEMTGEDFDVTPLVAISGNAAVADGRALAEAIVEALPTQCASDVADASPPAASSDTCLPNPAQTVTANDGSFRMTVDPGGYQLRIRPRDGSHLPWKIVPVVVGTAPQVVPPIVIPAPISVGMRLTDSAKGGLTPADNPVPNAVVRVFTDPSQGAPAVELGQAITDAQGNYEMYIAPPDQ